MEIEDQSELPLGLAGSGLSKPRRGERIETLAHLDAAATRDQPVSRAHLLALIPDSPSGFHQVFQRSMSKQDAKVLAHLRRRSVDAAAETWIDSDLFGQHRLSEQLENHTDSEAIVIMAHSTQNGKNLRLPDGSEIAAVEVHRLCQRLGRQCVIVTCNGQDLGIQGHITIAEAYGMWKAARALVGKQRVTSLGELSGAMQSARRRSQHHQRLAIIGVAVATGAVYWIHALQQSSKGSASVARRCTSTRRAERSATYALPPRLRVPPSSPAPMPALLHDGNLRPPRVSLPPPVLPPSLPLLNPPPPPLPSPRP